MIASELSGRIPECSFRSSHLRATSAGEFVFEPGSKAAGAESIDVADGVVRSARRRESPSDNSQLPVDNDEATGL